MGSTHRQAPPGVQEGAVVDALRRGRPEDATTRRYRRYGPRLPLADPADLALAALRTLSISSTTFRAHSLPSSPHLALTLSSLTHLHLHNLGLPHPSTHLHHLLSSSPSLTSLSLSLLPDLSGASLHAALNPATPRLKSLRLGILTAPQLAALPAILTDFERLRSLALMVPCPRGIDFAAIPSSVEVLEIRRPKQRSYEDEYDVVDAVVEGLQSGMGRGLKELRMWDLDWRRRAVVAELERRGIVAHFEKKW